MKKKMISVLAATILATGSLSHAQYDNIYIESEGLHGNNSIESADLCIAEKYGEGFTISGIVSSSDNEDWFKVQGGSGLAVGMIELDLEDTGLDANFYVYNSSGILLYIGNPVGQTKFIKDIALKDKTGYFIKVEYVSGVPEKPYELNILYEDIYLMPLSNTENLPLELKEELIKEGIIEDNKDQSKEIVKIDL